MGRFEGSGRRVFARLSSRDIENLGFDVRNFRILSGFWYV